MSFKITNEAQFKAEMAKRENALSKRRKVNAVALTVVDRWVQDNFKTEGGKVGGWQPLKPATIAARRSGPNKGAGTKILQDTGQLRQRWKHVLEGVKTAILRSSVVYGIYHDKGTKRLPQRRILPTMEEMAPTLKKVYESFIKKAVK